MPRAAAKAYRWVKGKIKGGLDADVQEAADLVVTILREDVGLPARIAEGRRPQSRQDDLYAQGRTRPGPIVTWTRRSKHTTGRAWDLGFTGYHPDDVPADWWAIAGQIGEAVGFTWGGRWRGKKLDRPHFEA